LFWIGGLVICELCQLITSGMGAPFLRYYRMDSEGLFLQFQGLGA